MKRNGCAGWNGARLCLCDWAVVVTFIFNHYPVCWIKARLAECNCVDKCSGMNEPLLLCGAEVGEMNGDEME